MTDRGSASGVPDDREHLAGAPTIDPTRACREPTRTAATIRVDEAGRIIAWDSGAKELYGFAETEVLGVSLRDLTLEMTGALTSAQVRAARDEAVARSEARFRALVQHSSDLVGIVDRSLTITYVSPSVSELLGVAPTTPIGRRVTAVVHRDDRDAFERHLIVLLGGGESGRPGPDVRMRSASGEWRTFEMVATDLLTDPAVAGIVINGRDVTDRRRGDIELRHRATHDPLTDLANRALFMDDLAVLLARSGPGVEPGSESGAASESESESGTGAESRAAAASGSGSSTAHVAVVAIGLDRFQTINDSLGHHAGDQVLVTSGERLRRATAVGGVLARVGGDTFVAATSVPSIADGRRFAEELIAILREPIQVAGRRITVATRAGLALSDTDSTAANLVRHADAALHRAKVVRADQIALFEPTIGDQANRRLDLEQALHHAVANDELRIHLQPIVTTDDGEPVGVEALVRWEHPDLGLVPPLDFIPLAEDTGDIIDIGRWVLHRSCQILADWRRGGLPLRLSVNLSARQFAEPHFVDNVRETLATTGFDPALLTLEVTESVLVEEGPAVMTMLQALRDLGIRLAIDDFGTGYSSLVYLRRLHVDALKIDKSFIDGLALGSDDDTIVRTIIDLASSLGLGVVAEGVETDEQRERLIAHGCEHAQGYLFAKPLEPDELIRRYPALSATDTGA